MNLLLNYLLLFHLLSPSAMLPQARMTTKNNAAAAYTYVGSADSGVCVVVPCYATYTPANAANLIIVDYYWGNPTTPTINPYDNGTTSYGVAVQDNAVWQSTEYVGEFYSCGTTGSPTHIGVNGSTPGGFGIIVVVTEYSFTGTCSLKQAASRNTGTGTTITGGAITTALASGLIHGAFFQHGIAQVVTGTSGFTTRRDAGSGGNATVSSLDDIVSSPGTLTATGTVSSSAPFLGWTLSY